MSQDETIKKKATTWLPLLVIALVVIVGILILLVTIFQQYSTLVTDNNKTNLMNIAKNIAEAMESEINQTKQGLHFFVDSGDLQQALSSYTDEGIDWPLNRLALSYSVYNSQIIDNMIIFTDSFKNPLWSLKRKDYTYLSTVSRNEFAEIELWLSGTDSHDCFLSITVRNQQGISITAMLDLHLMYDRLIAPIKLGEKGYALVKNSEGVILMYHLREQIGVNAVTGRQSLYPNVKLELDSLENMVNHQKEGREGIDVYQSYWWNEDKPKRITKIAAYCPVQIDDGFLIVSAVLDYKEITEQVTGGMTKVIILTLLVCLTLFSVVVMLISSFQEKNKVERRNNYLRQLNQTLLTLHENEQIIFHQQRLQLIGTMTSGIAHEFNNLLTPIMGYSALMMEQMDKNDRYYDDAHEIFMASEKAQDIIQQILSLGKRNTETVYKYTNAFTLLTQTGKMIGGILAANIKFEVQILDKQSGFFCNATQLYQVLLNMVVNAEAAIGKENGVIQLSYKKVSREEIEVMIPKESRGNLDLQLALFGQISVTDNGCGMDDQTCSKIFDPFFTTKATTGGSGLGLSIAQNIITSHKGIITVVSEQGKGTCFTITLPLAEPLSSKKINENLTGSSLLSRKEVIKVLLVDDNTSVLKVLQKSLSREHLEVF
ncbi:MAG: ATP-binding protein, partial [Sphaerochaetaceae bacterium]